MLGVDDRGYAACLLGFGYGVYGKSGLARRFRAVDLYDASPRIAPYAERVVESYRPRRYHVDILDLLVAELHYGSASIAFLYVTHGLGEGVEFGLYRVGLFVLFLGPFYGGLFFCHYIIVFCVIILRSGFPVSLSGFPIAVQR